MIEDSGQLVCELNAVLIVNAIQKTKEGNVCLRIINAGHFTKTVKIPKELDKVFCITTANYY